MNNPMNRICPSSNKRICWKIFRQLLGANKGKRPSRISMKPNANKRVCNKAYFREVEPAPELRMALKNSELLGSSTITSLLLAKLAL